MNTVLFDLDGTLLPLDQDAFIKSYFGLIAQKFSAPPFGYNPQSLVKGVMHGTKAMVKNNGEMTNEQRFWQVFSAEMGEDMRRFLPDFNLFYENEFLQLKALTKENVYAKQCVEALKEKGYTVVAATNPLFPKVATEARLSWAGVCYDDFDLVTTYEDCSFCKPNTQYYKEVLQTVAKAPQECLMVGNDADEDMCTGDMGMQTYLVTDCLVNRAGKDITVFAHGSFNSFWNKVQSLPNV